MPKTLDKELTNPQTKRTTLSYTSLGKSRYKLETLLPQLGKREQKKITDAIKASPSLSQKEKNRTLQMANPKDAEGLNALKLRFWHAILSSNKAEINKSLELIKLNNTKQGKIAQYQCLGYLILEPLMTKFFNFLEKRAEKTALEEFEGLLVANSKTVLKLNGRTYIEDNAVKKCLKASPQEIKNLKTFSQETHKHEGKYLLPIDGILKTIIA
jgi:hypothetical protein